MKPADRIFARENSIRSARTLAVEKLTQHNRLAIFVIILLLGIIALLLFINFRQASVIENTAFYNLHGEWRDTCKQACSKNFTIPPLIIISLDGFWANYLTRNITPAINKLRSCGAYAKHMYPAYPSKTFPNHYSIITGLYPAVHGIVDNHFYDRHPPSGICKNTHPHNFDDCSRFTIRTNKSAYYSGEPMWNTVIKAGKKALTMFWPGSELEIDGIRPTYHFKFDASVPFSYRVDEVISYLNMPEVDRPAFMTMYFDEPDGRGHQFGPNSDATKSAIITVDAMLNYLVHRLSESELLGCVNIVLVSDHGMAQVSKKKIYYSDNLGLKSSNFFLEEGVIGHVYFKDDMENVPDPFDVVPNITCKGGDKFLAYSSKTMPRATHYFNHRVGEVVLESTVGSWFMNNVRNLTGDHGYHNHAPEMRAIFSATGPSFRQIELQPFENIEIYNLLVDALGLPNAAPNNGTRGRLFPAFKRTPEYPTTEYQPAPQCESAQLSKCGDSCHFKLPVHDQEYCYPAHGISVNPFFSGCHVTLCNASLLFNDEKRVVAVEALLTDVGFNIDYRANCSLRMEFRPPAAPVSEANATNATRCQRQVFKNSISYFKNDSYLWFLEQSRIDAPKGFIEGAWTHLWSLINRFRGHYRKLRLFVGPIFDNDDDGHADRYSWSKVSPTPSHVFVVILTCKGAWTDDYTRCANTDNTKVISFALPLIEKDYNCLQPIAYLARNMLRVKDVEYLTGFEFFTDRDAYPPQRAIELRTFVNEIVWELEEVKNFA